jgi:hypothetical protein
MAVTDRVDRPAEPVRPDTTVDPDTPLILVVEDEALLRFAVVDLLEEMGFRVEAAASAREAAIRFASNGGAACGCSASFLARSGCPFSPRSARPIRRGTGA